MNPVPRHIHSDTLTYRVGELEGDVQALSRKVDRLMWAIITLALSLAGSAIVFAVTVATNTGA